MKNSYVMARLFFFAFCLLASAGLIAQNYSLDFDGSDDHVALGAMPVLNNASYLTLECWVKFDATPAATGSITIIHNYYTPGNYSRWMIVKSFLNDEVHLAVSDNSSSSNIFTTDANLVAGIWYHFALVFNGTQSGEENKLRFYINGLQKTLYFGAPSNGPLPNTLPGSGGTVYMGKTPSNAAALDGKLDDVRVWSTARTQAEIQSYMNTELSGSESGLVAYYKFDENDLNCDVGDCSNNDYHGARQGAGGSNNLPQYSDIIPTLTNVPCGTPINSTYYRDLDGDGFGNPLNTTQACILPSGYVTNDDDCDDNDALEFPGQIWYKDSDVDDYSDGTTLTQCLRPPSYYAAAELITTSGDCDDNHSFVHPGAQEVCDGVDNDCDGTLDNGTLTTYYADTDGDGYGNPLNTMQACSQPSGYVTDNTDCDDNDPLEKPGQVWYKDQDGDDYSDGTMLTQCLRPGGYYLATELMATSGDCDDNNAGINPGATEICDGIDNNCNSSIDEGSLTTYYRDMDGDSYGNPSNTTQACSQPTGYVSNDDDCDDSDALEFPGQTWYADLDDDGYSSGVTQVSCLRPGGHKVAVELASTTGDCNDNDEDINPAAAEVCDGIDNNCNSSIDEGTLTTYYRDMDGDSYGNPSNTTQACSQPTGYVSNDDDCDDSDALEFPGQTWYADLDDDGYSSGVTQVSCLRPGGHKVAGELTSIMGDCNDNDEDINPAAAEICDGIDNNCNSSIDEGTLTTYYRDMDGDGFGNPLNPTQACSQPTGYVSNDDDCDDSDALEFPGQTWYADLDDDGYSSGVTQVSCLRPGGHKVAVELASTTGDCNDNDDDINPAAAEICDGIDNNCNGLIDAADPSHMDITPPSPICFNATVYVQGDGVYILQPEDVLNFQASTDNCGAVSVFAMNPPIVSCDQVGQTIPVLVTASDGKDNKTDCISQVTVEQGTGLPSNWVGGDIGTSANGGSQYYPCNNNGNGSFTLSAQGYTTNITDVQHTVYQSLCGDAEIIAHINGLFPNGGWAGIQMRENASQGSKKFTLKTQLNTFLRREIRTATFGPTNTLQSLIPASHTWLKLERLGSNFSAFSSVDGINWVFRSTASIAMNDCIMVGLFVESINNTTISSASFDNVVITNGYLWPLIESPTGLTPQEVVTVPKVKVFPNPTTGHVTLDLIHFAGAPMQIDVFNIQGQLLYSKAIEMTQDLEPMDLSSLKSGIYMIQVKPKGAPREVIRVTID